MSATNSDNFFGNSDDTDGVVGAIVVEDATLVGQILEESENRICNRCFSRSRDIKGVVFFHPISPKLLTRLGRSDWALCSVCLSSLKDCGLPSFSGWLEN